MIWNRKPKHDPLTRIHLQVVHTENKEPPWASALLLRIAGGVLGLLMLAGGIALLSRGGSMGIVIIAMAVILTGAALFASSRKVEDWFGGL